MVKTFFSSLLIIFVTIFVAPAFAALPAGYTELEYIESTGTQYIDTGVKGGAGLSVDMVVQGTGDRGIIFSFDQDYTGSYVGDTGTDFIGPGTFTGISSLVKTDITTYWESENSKLKQTTTINGVTKTSNVYSRTPGVIALFKGASWSADNSFWAGKIFSFLLKSDGVAIRNFVPAKNSSGVVGMYDTINNRFYTNWGTGEFIAGPVAGIRIATTAYNAARFSQVKTDLNSAVATIREIVTNTINQTAAIASLQADKQTRPEDACPAGKKCLLVEDNNGKPHWYEIIENICGVPSGYTCLEYIQSTGTQYIDTGIYGTEHHGMEIKYSYPTLDSGYSGRLCGGRTGAGAENAFAYIATGAGTLVASSNFYMSSNNGTALTLAPLDTGIHTASINFSNNQKSYFDGQEAQTGGKTTSYVHQFTTNLFRAYNGTSGWATPARARIYFCKITDSGALVRDFVPAKNSSGVVGMYDTVNNVFYTNAGTGTFTAGPEM